MQRTTTRDALATPFALALKANALARIKQARSDGTTSMSIDNLRLCTRTPSTSLEGAPRGTNAAYYYAQLFRDVCRVDTRIAGFVRDCETRSKPAPAQPATAPAAVKPGTQHAATPGPWRIGDHGLTVFGPPSDQPAPVTIATMPGLTPRVSAEERKANAALIASAPSLAAQVQELRAEVQKLRAEVQTLRDAIEESLAWPDTDTTRAKLRAALEEVSP